MMKKPDSHEPANTNSALIQCTRGLTRSRPARKIPRKTDSAKNEKTPSTASVWPITPPAKFEKAAQLVPNRNSSGLPVTTPTAKLTAKIFAQKREAAS